MNVRLGFSLLALALVGCAEPAVRPIPPLTQAQVAPAPLPPPSSPSPSPAPAAFATPATKSKPQQASARDLAAQELWEEAYNQGLVELAELNRKKARLEEKADLKRLLARAARKTGRSDEAQLYQAQADRQLGRGATSSSAGLAWAQPGTQPTPAPTAPTGAPVTVTTIWNPASAAIPTATPRPPGFIGADGDYPKALPRGQRRSRGRGVAYADPDTPIEQEIVPNYPTRNPASYSQVQAKLERDRIRRQNEAILRSQEAQRARIQRRNQALVRQQWGRSTYQDFEPYSPQPYNPAPPPPPQMAPPPSPPSQPWEFQESLNFRS